MALFLYLSLSFFYVFCLLLGTCIGQKNFLLAVMAVVRVMLGQLRQLVSLVAFWRLFIFSALPARSS